jgi:hypothetical protein
MALPSTQVMSLTEQQAGGYVKVIDHGGKMPAGTLASWLSVWTRAKVAMPWLPASLVSAVQTLQANGYVALPVMEPEALPSRSDNDQKQWQVFVDGTKAFVMQTLKGQMAALQSEAVALDANKALWDGIAKWSGQEALAKVWDDLWKAIAEFRAARTATTATLAAARTALTALGAKAPESLRSKQTQLDSQVVSLTDRLKKLLAPLGDAAVRHAGLGVAPLVVAGITAAVVLAITASVWAVAREMASVQKQANDHAQAVLLARETADRADFEKGKITALELTERRKANSDAAVAISEAQGAAAIGASLGKAGTGIAIGVAVVGALLIGGIYLFRQARKA